MNLVIFPQLSALSQVMLVGVVYYSRKRLTPELKVLSFYFILSVVYVAAQMYFAFKGINNQWLQSLFTPIELGMLMYIFYSWNHNSLVGKAMFFSIPIYIFAWVAGILWFGGVAETFTYMAPISAAMLVLASSYTLLRIDRSEGSPVLSIPSFWISSATVIYFGSTFVFTSLIGSLSKASVPTMQLAYSVQSVVNILANFVYAGGLLCLRQKT